MNIRSIYDLNEYLDSELAWRKRELTTAKFLAAKAKPSTLEHHVLVKYAFCLLYSHWEGFIKRAGAAYLSYLSRLGLTQREAASSILAYCLIGRFRSVGDIRKFTPISAIIDDLIGPGRDALNIPWEHLSEDRSVLNPSLLQEIAHVTCIEYTVYATKEKLLEERLIKTRHSIVHGDRVDVDWDDYQDLHSEVIDLMELFRDQVENSIALQSYKRSST